MLSGTIRLSAAAVVLLATGAGGAKATLLTDSIPFTFVTDGSQTVRLPQLLGTLTAASATLSRVVQPVLEIFHTGAARLP